MTDISVDHITRRFDNGREALRDVTTHFDSGSMTFLTGHSGAGKSTFLRLLIGAELPSAGRVLVDGVDIGRLGPRRLPWYRRQVGVVFQDHMLLEDRSVFDNVALPLRVLQWSHNAIVRRVRGALGSVDLSGIENCLPSQLSSGQQQRIGIARAIVTRPRLILADEPTGNLDPFLSRQVISLFSQFNQLGTTVIVASHDVELIKSQQARILHLSEGRLVEDTAPIEAKPPAGGKHGE